MTIDSRDDSGSGPIVPGSTPHCRILVVDDTRLYREGLVHLLAEQVGRDAVRAADSLASVLVRLAAGVVDVVDVVVVNLRTCQSEEILGAIAERRPDARVVVVGVDDADDRQVISCAEAGVSGYLTRENSLLDLVAVIAEVTAGGSHVSPRISSVLLRRVREVAVRRPGATSFDALTDREIQILRLIGAGYGNQRIADELTIELHTVKNHVHSLLAKLGVRRRGEAAALLTGWDRLGRLPAGPGTVVLPSPQIDPATDRRVQAAHRGRGTS